MKSQTPVADQVTIRENKLTLVERLADDLAHEIKNPLHSMVINLEVLRRRLARSENETNHELLRYAVVLNAELERVNRRVDLLLRLVRPNRDSDDPTTLAEVIEELRELVELECERHQVVFELHPPMDVVRARFPRSSTRQMMLSLILKTLDSLGPGGTLRISTEVLPKTMRIRFEGLSANGDLAATASPAQDGAYLSVASALAERLGGKIEVERCRETSPHDAVSDGATIILNLPSEGGGIT